jgi:LPS export ABC transporter protein LptC
MLARIYALVFICIVPLAIWYQRSYLATLGTEFHAQLDAQTATLPINTGKKFQTLFYKQSLLKQSFSGDVVTYFSDNHFQAQGNLVYTEYDSKGQISIRIQAEHAMGEIQNMDQNDSSLFGNQKQLKFLSLSDDVFFEFQNNKGKTSNVYIDAIKKEIKSQNFIEIDGPNGHIEGVGFIYFFDQEELKLNSNVKGKVIPLQQKDSEKIL